MNFFKQILVILIACFFAMPLFAQNSTHPKKATHSGTPLSADQSKILCKAWKLDSISEFGVDNKASGKEANDGITFGSDGSFFITLDGVASTGTWTYASGHISAVAKNPDNTFSFKLVTLADDRLALDYQYPAPDLTRASFSYSPKK